MSQSKSDLPILGTTERYTFGRCPQKWWWMFRMGLVPKYGSSDALWLGIGVHLALAEWYQKGKKRGPHPADTFEDWAEGEMRWLSRSKEDWESEGAKYVDATQLGISMLEGYVDEYGKDESWYIIATEEPFSVQINRAGTPIAVFRSRWDGVFRDLVDGQIYLMETKTAGQISTAYLELDSQAGGYCAVADNMLRARGVLEKNERIAGIQYNFLRKALKDERPRNEGGAYLNKDGTVSKRQPAPRYVRPEPIERSVAENRAELEAIADEVAVMNAIRVGEIPVLKNRTKDCPWCQFFTMCKLHQRGGEAWLEVRKTDFVKQDPYNDDRKSA